MNLKKYHELLVPVGNYESLIQAINNGADAVYLGGKKFGARAFAENFTLDKIEEATKLCHLYGVKIYITVNTLVYESEIDDALEYCKELHKIGVDALIMQDVGLINLVHQTIPNMVIHASTQMHNHSSESINFLKSLGVKRIVFARELSLDYINNINSDIEKEVFIHGSLCVSYSGQCLFSSCILGRSGNCGECAGLCRLPYKLIENDKEINTDGEYILSPKDISSIDNFKKLMDSNIDSFKIEGRMKSPEYVGMVTKIYRTLIDQYNNGKELKIDDEDMFLLKAIFNREYTRGFLFNDIKIMNYKHPNHIGVGIGKVTNVTKKRIKIELNHDLKQFEGIRFKNSNKGMIVNFMYNESDNLINIGLKNHTIYLDNKVGLKELDEVMLTNPIIKLDKEITKKINVSISFEGYISNKMKITLLDGENTVEVLGNIVEKSKSAPITRKRIEEVLRKSGNTPFKVNKVDVNIDDNIFIPIGVLNELRRNVLDKLKMIRENKKCDYVENSIVFNNKNHDITNEVSVLVRTKEQLKACRDLNIKNIIVIDKQLMNNDLIYRVPRDNMHHFYEYKNLLVTDYASLDKYPNNPSDYFLNVTNHYTLDYISNYASKVMLSVECTNDDIKDILKKCSNKYNIEVLVYGNIELMLMKYCPLNMIINKNKICNVCSGNNKYYLKAQNGTKYRLITNKDVHSTTILNCNKTNKIDDIIYLKNIGVTNYRVEFLDENYDECLKILERVIENARQ